MLGESGTDHLGPRTVSAIVKLQVTSSMNSWLNLDLKAGLRELSA